MMIAVHAKLAKKVACNQPLTQPPTQPQIRPQIQPQIQPQIHTFPRIQTLEYTTATTNFDALGDAAPSCTQTQNQAQDLTQKQLIDKGLMASVAMDSECAESESDAEVANSQ